MHVEGQLITLWMKVACAHRQCANSGWAHCGEEGLATTSNASVSSTRLSTAAALAKSSRCGETTPTTLKGRSACAPASLHPPRSKCPLDMVTQLTPAACNGPLQWSRYAEPILSIRRATRPHHERRPRLLRSQSHHAERDICSCMPPLAQCTVV